MSLLFFDGFQDCNVMQKPEWDVAAAFSVQTGRDGTVASAGSLNVLGGNKMVTLPSAAPTCYVGVACKCTNASTFGGNQAGYRLLGFHRGVTLECVIVINSSGMIELRKLSSTGTLLATSSGHPPIAVDSWHSYQVKCVLHATAGTFELRLDGVTVINYAGSTAGTTGDVAAVSIGVHGASGLHWDDMWVCDAVDATATQGAPNNSFLGDLKVSTLFPSAAGDNSGFTPSTGVTNWSLVEEVPANTTDYVFTSVSATKDLYQMGDLPAGVAAPIATRTGLYAQKSDAGASSVKTLLKENGVLTTGPAVPLLTTWAGLFGPIRTVKPSAGTPWTIADINALQIGMELA